MSKKRTTDGLTKSQRYRLMNLAEYRAAKAAYARTPEERAKRTEYMREWRKLNRSRHNELARESHHRNKWKHAEKTADAHLRRSYGITSKEKSSMLAIQGGVCLICMKPPISRRVTHVDHDHITGAIRGILCGSCNTRLGWFEANRENVLKYLSKA